MIKREKGFSLIELLIVIAIMGFVLAAGSEMFVGLLRGYKQQSKIAETSIEGIIGLDMLRRDIESAGYGLPWVIPAGTSYQEATNETADDYNDEPSNPPRALLAGSNISATGYVNGSDYLVIKAVNLARNDAGTKWNYIPSGGVPPVWATDSENLDANDRIIVLSPGNPQISGSRALAAPTGNYPISLQFSNAPNPASSNETRIIYGVAPSATDSLRMPFNRADYYVSTTGTIPGRCAPNTGILKKAVVNQGSGAGAGGFSGNTVPLLDCVADMQIITKLDPLGTGSGYNTSDGLITAATTTAAGTIRDQLKEVHIYILAHEGERDTTYTHPTNTIRLGELVGATLYGRDFDLTTITNWQNYRWKIYTLVVSPNNLR